jgi:BioD-like phosphotransacetylase family protein
MKPVSSISIVDNRPTSCDAVLLKEKLGLEEPLELLAPVLLSTQDWEETPSSSTDNGANLISEAYSKLSQDCDLMLLEGATDMIEGYSLQLSASHIARLLHAKTILVVAFQLNFSLSCLLAARDRLEGYLTGVILNRVPEALIGRIGKEMPRKLERYGIPLFAILPENKRLCSVSVSQLAESLDGEMLYTSNAGEDLIENFSVGAMQVEQALSYFRRVPRKAVITGGDRADIQLAALETDTRCLVLTGYLNPAQAVLTEAEVRGVSVIMVHSSTWEAVQRLDEIFGQLRLKTERQIDYLKQMTRGQSWMDDLSSVLGLKP